MAWMRKGRAVLAAEAAAWAVLALPPAAVAQAQGSAPPAQGVDTVVVTAERRSTDLQKTPLSISVLSAATLDRSFVTQLSELSARAPGLEVTRQSGFENAVTIRGVGYATPENSPTNTPGVAEFIDGVYIANTISLDQTLFDVDRVEVLRGPQGALYGESADGGAISIVTRQPRLGVYDASGDASFGDYALHRERAEVNLPVGDTVAVRLSAQAFDHSGFTRNLALPQDRLDDAHDMSGKLAVLWKPNPGFSATLTGMVHHADENGQAQKNILEYTPGFLAKEPALRDARTVYQDYPATFDLTTQLYHLDLQWSLPFATLKSVTAYQQLDHVQQEDGSRSAYALIGFYDDVAAWNTHLENYNEELDLLSLPGSRLEWTLGAFAMAQKTRQFVVEYGGGPDRAAPNSDAHNLVDSVPADVQTRPPYNTSFGQLADVNRQAYAGFVQGVYHLTPRLRLTGGVRVNHDAYTPAVYDFSGVVGGVPAGAPSPQHVDGPAYSDTVPTFRAAVDADLTPTSLVYASIARGYKPGGVNNNSSAVVVPHTFRYEINTAYEVGTRNALLDRALMLNLSAFYYDYADFQYLEVDPFPFQYGTANIHSVHVYGLEGEGSYTSPDRRLRLNASFALENSFAQGGGGIIDQQVVNATAGAYAGGCTAGVYTFYGPGGAACAATIEAAAIPVQGKHTPNLAKASGSVNASYAFDLPRGTLTPFVEFVYRGSEWARIFNDPALDHIGAYGVWNFSLQYAPDRSRLRLSLAVTNAFDRDGVNARYTDPYGSGQTSEQYIAPRQVIGTLAFAF